MVHAKKANVLVLLISYNAEKHIAWVLSRIPALFDSPEYNVTVRLQDDASSDHTVVEANRYLAEHSMPVQVERNPINLRYGGNQKKGYGYAIDNGFDAVVMLHGDGQYAPEIIEQLFMPILNNEADCVLGSRMLHKRDALKGSMPFYKFLGNISLTFIQNWLLGSKLSEFHTGYRAYSVPMLAKLPFPRNSDGFSFDTDILIQVIQNRYRIREIAIPTYYGDEISHVQPLWYALVIFWTTLRASIFSWTKLAKFTYGGD